jgi:2-methylcitrate dehydratase PrpD
VAGVRAIRLEVGEECVRTCNVPSPTTGAQARFSLRFNAAVGLLGLPSGEVGTYSEETCRDPALVDLIARTDVVFVAGRPLTLADMHVEFEDGSVASVQADTSRPKSDLDAQEAILLAKFDHLSRAWPDRDAMHSLRGMALDLDRVADIRSAMHLLGGGTSSASR